MDGIQHFTCSCLQLIQGYKALLMVIPAHQHDLVLLYILWPYLHAKGHAAHLAVSELPARTLVRIIDLYSESCLCKALLQLICLIQHTLLLLLYRHHHNLDRRNSRRQHQTVVIAMHHDDGADDTGAHTPGCLVYIL